MDKVRKSPTDSATKFSVGTKKKGNDGNIWIVTETHTGVHRWTRYNKLDKKKSMKKLSIKKRSKKGSKKLSKKVSQKNEFREKHIKWISKQPLYERYYNKLAESKKAIIKLRPLLLMDQYDAPIDNYKDCKLIYDLILKRLNKDFTRVKNIYKYSSFLKQTKFRFNPISKLFEITVVPLNGVFDYETIYDIFETIEAGPDTWQGGNIQIIDYDEAIDCPKLFRQLRMSTGDSVELIVKINDVVPI